MTRNKRKNGKKKKSKTTNLFIILGWALSRQSSKSQIWIPNLIFGNSNDSTFGFCISNKIHFNCFIFYFSFWIIVKLLLFSVFYTPIKMISATSYYYSLWIWIYEKKNDIYNSIFKKNLIRFSGKDYWIYLILFSLNGAVFSIFLAWMRGLENVMCRVWTLEQFQIESVIIFIEFIKQTSKAIIF